jgi:protein-disulfide isomerase
MNRSQFLIGLIFVAVVALGVAAYFVFFNTPSDTTSAAPSGALSYTLTKDDRTQGSPKAPITMIEYAAPTCPICAHFDIAMFPQLKQQYIDMGKVYYVFRVYPLQAADVAAEAMARCLPEDSYFQFIEMLYHNQSKWDPDGYNIPDVHGALVQMGNIAGLTAEKTDSCISDKAQTQRIEQVGADAQVRYGINGTPTFIINGQMHGPFADFAEVQATLDPMLNKK